jgi:succinate dehydrogenase/fumarate reductase flavoprotein subunit
MMPDKVDMETDVIVVGYGCAGGAAAISANDNGASVIILEKMAVPYSNSRCSAGNQMYPKDPKDKDKYADYLHAISFGSVEREIVDAFVDGLLENPDWYKKMGGELQVFLFPPATISLYIPSKTYSKIPEAQGLELQLHNLEQSETSPEHTGGDRVWNLLNREIKKRDGIKIMLATPAKELVKNDNGEIVGVIAESEGKNIFVKAKKGVIMTCGGFEFDEDLKREHLTPRPIFSFGNPGNTGDGIRMVQKAGASLWHMGKQATYLAPKVPEFEAGFVINLLAPGFIYVDRQAKRWGDETHIECHEFWVPLSEFDTDRFEYPRVPTYLIFDEEVKRIGPISYATMGYNVVANKYIWSSDNSAEIKKGWIVEAKKISDLAKKTSLDEATLTNTINRYNELCKANKDEDFGRPKEFLKAIEPPYYAIPLWPVLFNTQGGPRRDKHARVLDPDGEPMPRLYAAGEFGSIWGFLYQTSTNFSETIVFGRIAGKHCANLPPSESSS